VLDGGCTWLLIERSAQNPFKPVGFFSSSSHQHFSKTQVARRLFDEFDEACFGTDYSVVQGSEPVA
ncbi:MAG: hypothetical protein WBB22_17040, partial [Anaerolineae bacterium]